MENFRLKRTVVEEAKISSDVAHVFTNGQSKEVSVKTIKNIIQIGF